MTTSTSTLPRHADAIRRHMRAWGFHLHHDDPAFRLVALQEIREYIDALMVHEEHRITQPQHNTATGECGGALRRLMTHLKNFPRERSLP